MEMETSHLANVKELALTDPDITLYVNGSRYADENGKYHTGYAVTSEKDVIRAFSLPPSMSAQEAELIALTKACEIATGVRANIYTDSRYALGVTQDFGIIWKARGFMTAAGTPVKHDKAIRELLDALALPKEVAILKVKAHGKLNSDEARGNHLADQMAKKAAMISQEMDKKEEKKDINIYTMQTLPTDLKLLKELQKTADPEEVNKWKAKGAILKDGLYVDNLRLCLPKNLYPATVQWAHGPAHLSKTLMNALIDKYYMDDQRPIQFLNMTAKITVKRLLTEVICRYAVPEVIESDQGPAFTAALAKEIWAALGVTLSFHTPYHPQSSGKDAMTKASPTFVHQNLELDFGDQDDTYKTSHMLKQMTTGSKESVL
ncbi:LOW QUALITY PROTEIN: uncharacterized protein O3C94_009991 [Discoglossus pictus]